MKKEEDNELADLISKKIKDLTELKKVDVSEEFINWYNSTYNKNISKEVYNDNIFLEVFFEESEFLVIYENWLNIKNRGKKIKSIKEKLHNLSPI